MRNVNFICFLITLLSMSDMSAYSQIEKSLRFNPETLDFGCIRETDGPVSKTVQAINISQDTTFIISARTSCGCSEAEFDARYIAPGDSSIVTITYDPTNRPGKFLKSAKIFTGKERISNTFRLKGNVIPSRSHLDKVYPEKANHLRLSNRFISVGEIRPTETKSFFIGIYNDSELPLSIDVDSDNEALDAKIQPEIIEPFGVSTISLMLKGRYIRNDVSDFKFNVNVRDKSNDELIVSIPVVGAVKKPQ